MVNKWIEYLEQNKDQQLMKLKEFLKIPSVSALSKHKKDIHKAARWLSNELERYWHGKCKSDGNRRITLSYMLTGSMQIISLLY